MIKKHVATIGLVFLCGILLCGCTQDKQIVDNDKAYENKTSYTQKDLDNVKKSLKKKQQEKEELFKKLKQSEENERKVSTYNAKIEAAKEDILRIQKECIRIGKYVCKVNTCQTNPDDKNYQIYLDITFELKDAKSVLFKLQDEQKAAQASADKKERYAKEVKTLEEKIKDLQEEKTKIEHYFDKS